MKFLHLYILFLFVAVLGMTIHIFVKLSIPTVQLETANVTEQYVAKVKVAGSDIRVRLIILKHCRERVADSESDGVIEVANLAASQGLDITDLGQHHINKNGPTRVIWTKTSLSGLKKFVSEQMKVNASQGDTFIIYTTGHGGPDGGLASLGQRREIGQMFIEAAEENEQETLWWQSSCFAAAGLPNINSLNAVQKEYFSMIASSTANRSSYWHDQTPLMKKVFIALANNDKRLDRNEDGSISANELGQFIDRKNLVFAASGDEPIFGWRDFANEIPIRDWDGFKNYPDRYVPHPGSGKIPLD